MSETPYQIICGLEVHVELLTNTKMFCRCLNNPFHADRANQYICPICLGLPGALPVPNLEAVRKTVLIGLALGSDFSEPSHWDRKHYFYPDLPKGYQISQLDRPLCVGGQLDLLAADGSVESTIRFIRAHLEEDAGKLQHGKDGFSQVDLNRAGVPLLEMVTEPDLRSASQARRFLQEVQLLVRTLAASNADMEKGEMRCDVNVNIKFEDPKSQEAVWTPITEIKNVNSTRAVERSITVEAQRQYDEWCSGGPITKRKGKITVGWDEDSGSVNLQRAKEGSADYRYMPEPDLPPINLSQVPALNPTKLKEQLPVLPNQRRRQLLEAGIAWKDTETLMYDPVRGHYLDQVLEQAEPIALKTIVNWIINAEAVLNLPIPVVAKLINLTDSGELSFSGLKPHLASLSAQLEQNPSLELKNWLQEMGLLQQHDQSVVESLVQSVLREYADVVSQYRQGDRRVFGFLVGKVMQKAAGQAQPAKVSQTLKEALEKQ